MDDGQDEADAMKVSEKDAEQKEVEMDFNTLIQTTAAGQVCMYFSSWRSFSKCLICLHLLNPCRRSVDTY